MGHFQVLACIPQGESVSFEDISHLVGVPETQLRRVLRTAATFGFLKEPQPGKIGHSTLSTAFVTDPSLLDAVMFMASTSLPAALQMPAGTKRFGDSTSCSETAYNISSDSSDRFSAACESRPQMQRQWLAFWRHATGEVDDDLAELLPSLQCAPRLRGGSGRLVEVRARANTRLFGIYMLKCTLQIGARSITQAAAIVKQYPSLQVTVQMEDSESPVAHASRVPCIMGQIAHDGRLAIQRRAMGTPQPVHDAVVYVLRLTTLAAESDGLRKKRIQNELHLLIQILKKNSSATVVLTSGLLPDLGTAGPKIEARARLRDLTLFQLTNQKELELAEAIKILNGVGDDTGHLVLVGRHCSPTSGDLALELKYRSFMNAVS